MNETIDHEAIDVDSRYLDAFEKGMIFERDKQKEELIKATKDIAKELHELNKNLRRR